MKVLGECTTKMLMDIFIIGVGRFWIIEIRMGRCATTLSVNITISGVRT